jgi:serine protease Do
MPANSQSKSSFRDLRAGLIGGGSALALMALVFGAPTFAQQGAKTDAPKAAVSLVSPVTGAVASFADVVDRVKPAVVSVRVKTRAAQVASPFGNGEDMSELPPGHPLERFFKREGKGEGREGRQGRRGGEGLAQSQGSGFFISADGYVVTNHHVIDKGVEVQVVMDDGRTFDAKVVGSDARTDVALLKVEQKGDYPFVSFAAGNPRIGDWVVAVGNPFGLGGTVTSGIVSARGRDIGAGPYDDFLQIDAPVNRGNSGGPSFNLAGEVVGVNTAIASPSGGSVGIAFAIPAATVQQVVAQLKDGGQVARGFLGIQIQPVTPEVADAIGLKEPKGALIASLEANGPAVKSGLKRGDVVLSVDGESIKDAKDLTRRVGQRQPGAKAELKLWREGKEQALSVTLGRQPQA